MQFIKYFTNFLILMFYLSSSVFASSVVKYHCGDTLFLIEKHNISDKMKTHYNLFYVENKKKILVYAGENGLPFYASCLKNTKGEALMVFEVFCGGSACPEDRYSIFDPRTKKMLLKSTGIFKGNSDKATEILGYIPPLLYENNSGAICCDD